MRNFAKLTTLATLLCVAFVANAADQEKKWDWLSATWTPCEGIGVHGSARYYAIANTTAAPGSSATVHFLRLYGSSAAFTPNDTSLSATVSVVDSNGKETQVTNMIRPDAAGIEPAPGPNDSRSLYLPTGTVLTVAQTSAVRIKVTAVKANCHINSSTNDNKV